MRVVALAGGVGGAKLAHGAPGGVGAELTVVVNTGDDLERHGLLVCPDHDTVMYTLAGLDDRERAGASRARPGTRPTSSRATARRPGSGSATATSRRTSSGPRGCAPAPA